MSSSSKKTLLVLAASHYQCDAIRTAQRLGYRVVTTDNRPENPGHRLADRSYSADTTDRVGVLEIARGENVSGVLAPCTDVATPTAAYVAGALGLRGPSVVSTATVCDKIRFRQFLERHRFPVPQWMEEHGTEARELSWPGEGRWIVKPSQSSGSKGVIVVESAKELRAALPAAFAYSKSGEAIVEQFLDGHQGTLEGWLRDGEIAWHCLLDRQTAPLPFTATHGHATPSTLSAEQAAAVVENVARLWRELGVSDGPFDCDFVVLGRSVYVLEVSPRLGGNAICELIRSSCGLDLVELAVRWVCGEDMGALSAHPPSPRAVVLLGSPRAGRLRYDREAAAALAREPWVESLEWDASPGAAVQPFNDGRHRVGQALLAAADRDELASRIQEFRDRLHLSAQ